MKKGVQLQTGNTIGMQWYPKKIAFVSSVFVLAFMLIFSNQRNAIVYASIALIPSEQCSGDFNGASHASGFSDLPEMNEESFSGTNAASTSTPNATLVCHVFNGAIPETSEQKLVLNISWVMRPAATTEFFEHTPEPTMSASQLQSDIDTNTDTVVADLDGEVHIIRDHIIPVPPRENIPSSSLVEILYSLGDGWQTLDVIDEVDGLASFELPHTVVAGDLSNLTVAIRNLQQLSDRTLYIDAVWIDVQIPEDQITKKQSQEVITRKYDVPFVVNSLATHRCSSEQFNINLSAKRSTSVILDLSYDYSQSSHSLTIGSLPAGIDVRFTESDDYQYILSEQEDVVHLDITRVQDAIHGNFTIPIIFTETGEVDSITTCQINIIH